MGDKRKFPLELEEACAEMVRTERSRADAAEATIASMRAEVKKTKTSLETIERTEFSSLIRKFATAWKNKDAQPLRDQLMLDDPVYQHLVLDEATATVLRHPLVQRLNYIKQLSFSYLQFPSATHTRLAHSLGAAKNAELAMQGMLDRGVYYSADGEADLPKDVLGRRSELIRKAKITALLHDLGHGPFGHALDKYIGFLDPADPKPSPDKYYTTTYIEEFLCQTLEQRDVGLNAAEIAAILRPQKQYKLPGMDALIADIVDSPLDADRMDYLVRDAHMTGLAMGFTNTRALIDRMRPFRKEDQYLLSYDRSAVPYIEHFLYARDAMFINCYEHPKKLVAERIFTKIISSLLEDRSLNLSACDLIALTDEQIMLLLGMGSGLEDRTKLAHQLTLNEEYVLIHEIPLSSASVAEKVRKWNEEALEGLQGDPKKTYILDPAHWEDAIAAKSIGAARNGQVAVVVPSYEVYQAQLSGTNILVQDESGRFKREPFFDLSPIMRDVLQHLMKQRRKIRVFCSAEVDATEKAKIRTQAMEFLGQ